VGGWTPNPPQPCSPNHAGGGCAFRHRAVVVRARRGAVVAASGPQPDDDASPTAKEVVKVDVQWPTSSSPVEPEIVSDAAAPPKSGAW
jgi:hypothetical protein